MNVPTFTAPVAVIAPPAERVRPPMAAVTGAFSAILLLALSVSVLADDHETGAATVMSPACVPRLPDPPVETVTLDVAKAACRSETLRIELSPLGAHAPVERGPPDVVGLVIVTSSGSSNKVPTGPAEALRLVEPPNWRIPWLETSAKPPSVRPWALNEPSKSV